MSVVSDSIQLILRAGNIAAKWVQGGANETVETNNGPIQTLAGVTATAVDKIIEKLSATSNSKVAIGIGTKTFTTQAGKAFRPNQFLSAMTTNGDYVAGNIVSYTGTTLVMACTHFRGTGDASTWGLSTSAVPGQNGRDGEDAEPSTPGGGEPAVTEKLFVKMPWDV